ncbi:hypothetical protein DH09_14915 [Bacillaceae bacterium JMAK1]|nr:hypothetical protein DH09_14915 [Bacillaceae bacterium JMAK1]
MKNIELKIEGNVLHFKYLEMATTVEEAKEQADYVKSELMKPSVRFFLNDNSEINQVAKPEVNEVWGELMGWVAQNIEKTATIAPGATLKMQLNRLSRTAGTYEHVRAFTNKEQALAFIGSAN